MANTGWNNQLVTLLIISASGGFTGLFVYSPSPGPGNLIMSIAASAGTDPFGNAFPSGVTVGKNTSTQMELFSNAGTGFLRFLLNNAGYSNANLFASIPANFASIVLNGPQKLGNASFDDFIGLEMNSSDGVSSSANFEFVYNDANGGAQVLLDGGYYGTHIDECSAITATMPGTGTSATNPAQQETWHDLRPLSNSFIGTISGQYPPQYRKLPDGRIEIAGYVQIPASGGPNFNSVVFATLPAAYRPTANGGHRWPVTFSTNVAPVGTGLLQIDTSGTLQFHSLPTSGMNSNICCIQGTYPLDNTGLIQS